MMSELVFYLIFLMIENWLNLIQNEAFLCYFPEWIINICMTVQTISKIL